MGLRPGDIVGPYALLEPLGSGGQGTVWRAFDRTNGWNVALKIIPTQSDVAIARARQEARALERLDHPSLPRCYASVEDPARRILAIALELVDGDDLGDVELSPAQRVHALRHVADALAHLHGLSIVHRDVKPGNIIVSRDFFAAPEEARHLKLVDLGIAVLIGNPDPLTKAGHPGTTPFLAPEALDPRTFRSREAQPTLDVFAFGVLGWLLVKGRHPTGLPLDADDAELVARYAEYVDAEDAWLPVDGFVDPVEQLLARCLQLRASGRPQDAGEVRDELDRVVQRPAAMQIKTAPGTPWTPPVTRSDDVGSEPLETASRPRSSRVGLVVAGFGVIAIAVGVGWMGGRSSGAEDGSEDAPIELTRGARVVETGSAAEVVADREEASAPMTAPAEPGCYVVILYTLSAAGGPDDYSGTRAELRRHAELADIRYGVATIGKDLVLIGVSEDKTKADALAAVHYADPKLNQKRSAACRNYAWNEQFGKDWMTK
ncbi:MAG: serine/threonine protein kinase [Polyangiaceae bacterium]|nr:serine/threonine protein kinase [Polyangiaceae bacterium]